MRTRERAIAMVLIIAFYLTIVGPRASILLQSVRAETRLIGLAIFAVPLLAVGVMWREARFGRAVERLGDQLVAAGQLGPEAQWASRRLDPTLDPASFEMLFTARRMEVDASPHDWAAWYRLGLAYDAVGDRSNGRAAFQRAVSLSRRAGRPV